jgi:hypothetical protein
MRRGPKRGPKCVRNIRIGAPRAPDERQPEVGRVALAEILRVEAARRARVVGYLVAGWRRR